MDTWIGIICNRTYLSDATVISLLYLLYIHNLRRVLFFPCRFSCIELLNLSLLIKLHCFNVKHCKWNLFKLFLCCLVNVDRFLCILNWFNIKRIVWIFHNNYVYPKHFNVHARQAISSLSEIKEQNQTWWIYTSDFLNHNIFLKEPCWARTEGWLLVF